MTALDWKHATHPDKNVSRSYPYPHTLLLPQQTLHTHSMSAIHSDAEVLRLAVKCANSLATESHLVVTDAAESILYVPHALDGHVVR